MGSAFTIKLEASDELRELVDRLSPPAEKCGDVRTQPEKLTINGSPLTDAAAHCLERAGNVAAIRGEFREWCAKVNVIDILIAVLESDTSAVEDFIARVKSVSGSPSRDVLETAKSVRRDWYGC